MPMEPTLRKGKKEFQNGHTNGYTNGKHVIGNGVSKQNDKESSQKLHDPSERVLFVDKFSGVRLAARNLFHNLVISGTDHIVEIQKGKASWKTKLWNFVSIVGSHDFFLAFFPLIIYGFGLPDLGGRLLQRAALGIWLGNWFKDYLCLPRPPCPPVQQLNNMGNHEFGLPSTHAVTAVCLPFFTLLTLFPASLEVTFLLWLAIASVYGYAIAYSRLYLGMHSPADVIAGLVIGVIILIGGHFWEQMMDVYGIVIPNMEISIFVIYLLLLMIHPEPNGPCPCFEDSACFLGSAGGYLAGVHRCTDVGFVVNRTLQLGLVRWIVGSGLLFLGRVIYKPLVRGVFAKVLETMKWPRYSYVYPHESKKDDKPFPSPKWNVDILIKYIIYFIIVENGIELSPHIFTYFNWW